jgi:hypothetical protein
MLSLGLHIAIACLCLNSCLVPLSGAEVMAGAHVMGRAWMILAHQHAAQVYLDA